MKRYLSLTLLCSLAPFAQAGTKMDQCLQNKYHAYLDASLDWYRDLINITTDRNPDLKQVGQQFLISRQHHFDLSGVAFNYYLYTDPSKVTLEQPVEHWLKLSQQDVKQLAKRDDELGKAAKLTYNDRQKAPNQQNYQLRSAFSQILSNPNIIGTALNKYNTSITKIDLTLCK
ncbi:hypothetical protein L4C34_04550 [Vibrio profundum]|uniref:hypothetical protein n=1 Tax=Vibrio profundum TaxID=2910247 RepID=UPI003D0B36E7